MNEIGQLTIRDATPEDAPTLLRILREAFDEYKHVLEPPSGAHAETLETVRRHLADGAAVLASIDREPVGFAFYEPAGPLVYFSRLTEYKTRTGYSMPTYVYMEKVWAAEFADTEARKIRRREDAKARTRRPC